MDEREIIDLVKEKADILRKRTSALDSDSDRSRERAKDYEPNPIYNRSVEMRRRISVHSDIGVFPTELFATRAPNETEEEFEYRRKTFKNNTRGDWNRAVNSIQRVWHPGNYSLTFGEMPSAFDGETMREYVYDYYPKDSSLIGYFQSIVTKSKENDPNGIITTKPRFIPLIENNEELTVDDTVLLEPVCTIYKSDQVIDYRAGEYALVELKEKSYVEVGGKQKKEGFIFEYYDKVNIYTIRQVGKKSDLDFSIEIYFAHNLGWVPAYKLEGVPIGDDDHELGYQLFKSPFYDAVDHLDVALYNFSTLNCSVVANAYMEKWEYADECDAPGCTDGRVNEYDDTQEKNVYHTCSSCEGTGRKSKRGPLGVYQIKSKGMNINPDDMIAPPPFGYVPKDATILEFLSKEIDKEKAEAFKMTAIGNRSKVDGNTPTATEVRDDRDEFYSLIRNEADKLFELLDYVLWDTGYMRYGESYPGHTLLKPTQFYLNTSFELTEEIKLADEAGAPPLVTSALRKQYIDTRFNSTDPVLKRVNDIVNYVDGLANLDNADIIGYISTGILSKWESRLHTKILSYIEQKIAGDPQYLDKELADIKTDLETMAKTEDTAANPKVNATDIIDRINV